MNSIASTYKEADAVQEHGGSEEVREGAHLQRRPIKVRCIEVGEPPHEDDN